jgi:hypothetical protein
VVMPGNGPSSCAATISDRRSRQQSGAITLRRAGEGFAVTPTRPHGYDRPWARAIPPAAEAAAAAPGVSPVSRDATPRAEDLEPGD